MPKKDGRNKKTKILIIEDDLGALENINDIIEEYSNDFSIDVINPQKTTLNNILQIISSNDYVHLFLDHNYKMSFTGEDIARESDFSGSIISITGDNNKYNYCDTYIGKLRLSVFQTFTESFIQEPFYA